MPLSKIVFKPGINKEGTNYSNEGGYYNCDKIRFRSGYPEKLGGWLNLSFTATYKGIARSMMNWVTRDGFNLLALGTNQKYYIEQGTTYNDITPLAGDAVSLGASPISVMAASKVVTITAIGHGVTAGTYVTLTSTATVGDLDINGEYEVVTTPDSDTYTIASATAASFTATGGGTVTAEYQINAGNSIVTSGVGWGAGGWGLGGWGEAATTSVTLPLRLWTQDYYEQDLIFAPVGGNLYFWAKDTATYNRAITLQAAASAETKTIVITTAASAAGTTTIDVDTTEGIYTGSPISGTNIAAGTYVGLSWNYGLSLPLVNDTVLPGDIITGAGVGSGATITVGFAGKHAPNETNYVVASDTSHFTIVLGSKPYDPTDFNPPFDPMLVRWSDQENPFDWVPATGNQSGEQHLSNGSYLVAAQNNRQEIMVWSDVALFSMQYLGPPYVWGFNLIGDNTSIASPNAAIAVNTVAYWMGVDKFYQYNGRLETLNCTLWKFVYDNLNRNQLSQVVCGSNEGYSEIWWFYPSLNSNVNDSYIIYNYLDQTWYYGTLNRTAWLDSPLRTSPMGAFSIQTSYLATDIDETSVSIPLVDGSSYPASGTVTIDNEQITYTSISGNNLTVGTRGANGSTAATHTAYTAVAYNVPNQVMYHEVGCDDRSASLTQPIAGYVESSDFDIDDGYNFAFVNRVIPDLTFRNSTATSPSVIMTFRARKNTTSSALQTSGPGSAYADVGTTPTTVTRTSDSTAVVEQFTSEVFTRVRGRQMSFKVENTALGVAWQSGAMRIDVKPDGRR